MPPGPPAVETAEAAGDTAAAAADAAGDTGAEGMTGPSEVTSEFFPWLCCCLSTAIYSMFTLSLVQHAAAAAAAADTEDDGDANETQSPSPAASGDLLLQLAAVASPG